MQAHDARNLLQYLESDKANQNYSEEAQRHSLLSHRSHRYWDFTILTSFGHSCFRARFGTVTRVPTALRLDVRVERRKDDRIGSATLCAVSGCDRCRSLMLALATIIFRFYVDVLRSFVNEPTLTKFPLIALSVAFGLCVLQKVQEVGTQKSFL